MSDKGGLFSYMDSVNDQFIMGGTVLGVYNPEMQQGAIGLFYRFIHTDRPKFNFFLEALEILRQAYPGNNLVILSGLEVNGAGDPRKIMMERGLVEHLVGETFPECKAFWPTDDVQITRMRINQDEGFNLTHHLTESDFVRPLEEDY